MKKLNGDHKKIFILTLFSLAFIFLFTFGCVERENILYNTTGADRDLLYDISGAQISNAPNQTNLSEYIKDFCNDTGVCMAFMCKNGSQGFLIDILPWTDQTLKGGNCWVVKGNSTKEFTDDSSTLLEKRKKELDAEYDFFRIGTGSSFLEGIYADYYTNCTNTMHQKWLISNLDNTLYPYPNRERLECMLEKGQIPTIVIPKGEADLTFEGYPGGVPPGVIPRVGRITEIDRLINTSFKNKDGESIGPVIVVLEAGAELIDAPYIYLEAYHLKSKYPEVLIAVDPPKENRTEFLDIVVKGKDMIGDGCIDPTNLSTEYKHEYCTDMIAEDIIFNDFDKCNENYVMVHLFDRGLSNLREYSKPSMIYMFGGKTGNNTANTCQWFNTDLANTYEILMREIPFLTRAGYLSVQQCNPVESLISANANPFCNDKNYSLNKQSGINFQGENFVKDVSFKVWTVNTWGYIETGAHSPLVFSETGGYSMGCLGLVNLKWLNPDQFLLSEDTVRNPSDINYSFYDDLYDNLTIIGDDVLSISSYSEDLNTCGSCFVCGVLKENSGGVNQMIGASGYNSVNCSIYDYDILNLTGYADIYDLDTYSVFALADIDSTINKQDVEDYYVSYKECENKINKNWVSLKNSGLNEESASWTLIALSYHDYYSVKSSGSDNNGHYCDDFIDDYLSSGSSFSLENYIGSPDIRSTFTSNTKNTLKYYRSYVHSCKDKYYKRCF